MNKPKLDEIAMTEELGAVASFARSHPTDHPVVTHDVTAVLEPDANQADDEPISTNDSSAGIELPPDQVAGPSDNQSTRQSADRSTERPSGTVVGRPKAFYITERLNKRLDEAVRYYQTVHGVAKVDRSTIVNALLDNESLWTDEALDSQTDRVISQLTSRLTG